MKQNYNIYTIALKTVLPQDTKGDIARNSVSKRKSKNISKTNKKGKSINNTTKEIELRYSNSDPLNRLVVSVNLITAARISRDHITKK